MSDVIGKWLTETLGVIVEVYSETFVRLIQNGYLVAAVLRHYNIITAEHLTSLTSAKDTTEALDNIAIWLREVNIRLDDETKKRLAQGKVSTALELFYKLYLVFQAKDPLHYTAEQIRTQNSRYTNERFEVRRVGDKEPLEPDIEEPRCIISTLSDYQHIVQWHKDRYQQLVQQCQRLRQNYEEFMIKRDKKPAMTFKPVSGNKVPQEVITYDNEDLQSLNETYDNLIEQEHIVLTHPPFMPDPKVTKKIVKNIKTKYDKERQGMAFQSKMEAMVLGNFWDELLHMQSKRIEANISEKMLKQSYYEKQMINKMFEIREQKEIMAENRIAVLKEIGKQKDGELLERIFAKEKEFADERYRYYFEKNRVLELHKRIYEEKKRLKNARKLDMCECILEDMIDIVFRCAEYKREYEAEMPRRLLADLAALFISSKPIFDLVPNEEVIIEYEPQDNTEEEIYLEEISRQNAMDIRSFESYCNFEWPWELEVHVPNCAQKTTLCSIETAMNVLGHIVFRLLLAKYPKPPLKPPPNIPKVHIAACINTISDQTVLPILEKLLSEKQIKVIQMEDAINYCLAAYKDEVTEEYPESQFVEETENALQKVSIKKDAKKAKPEKNNETKRKGEKKDKKKVTPLDISTTVVETMYQQKLVQTPKIFPCDEPVLSHVAKLGQFAHDILQLGEGLNDKLLVEMFVEYLKGLKNIDGWCLINYPTNIIQSLLLEEALSSKPVTLPLDFLKKETKPTEEVSVTSKSSKTDSANVNKSTSSGSFGLRALFCSQEKFDSSSNTNIKEKPNDLAVDDTIKNATNDTIEDIANLDYRELKQNNVMDDSNAKYRVSRILTNPDPPETVEDYNCYLTAFIKVIQDVSGQNSTAKLAEPDDVDRFYQCQGCLYNLFYKVFDLATIKHIGKLIIGDYTIPPKSSVQIFGDVVLYLENDLNQYEPTAGKVSESVYGGPKQEKPHTPTAQAPKKENPDQDKNAKKGKPKSDKSGEKGTNKGKNEKVVEEPDIVIIKSDKETQYPEPILEYEEITLAEPAPTPGQCNWKYVDLPIPDFFMVALATLWENVEEVYVCDIRELFFRRRVLWKTVIPYLAFVKRYMLEYIDRPDDKQIHLYNFQRIYNEIPEDMRDDDEVKAELHCRIEEFKEKLWQICDTRMTESEKERQAVIMKDWTAKQACELTNLYVTSMQLEIDRSADTLQLLNDYYVAMITKMPCADDVLEKIFLTYITFKDDFEFENCQTYSGFVRKCLVFDEEVTDTSPYHRLLNDNYKEATKAARNYEANSLRILSDMEVYFYPKGKSPKKGSKEEGKGKVKGKPKLPKFSAPAPEVKDVGLKLIDEWRCAVEGELKRIGLRLDLLKSVASDDLKDMLTASVKMFRGLYHEIKGRYDREIDSIKKCCKILCRAVEEEMAIQPELILRGDKFYINPDVLLFEDPLPEPELTLQEYEKPSAFTIAQLSYLTDILFDLAPTGLMPERTFTFLLQDLIVTNAEDGRSPAVPEFWRQIPLKNMDKLSYEFFGQTEVIDWKDFIIFNLCVEFPDEVQLMQTRRQFREFDVDSHEFVYDYQFHTVKFWFEFQFNLEDPQQALRLREMKTLLFKLFRIKHDCVNYTALLLQFCKDADECMGLVKALELSLGKLVCWDTQTGNTFSTILRQRQLERLQDKVRIELQQAEKYDIVDDVVHDLIDVTVHQCDSVTLESQYSSENNVTIEANNVSTIGEVVDPELAYLDKLMYEYDSRYQEEGSFYQHILQEEFSNVGIGFEPEFYPSKVYYLAFDVLLTVVVAAMPWETTAKHNDEPSFRQSLEVVYNSCKNPEFENNVLMHEFLNSNAVKELFKNNYKFLVKKPGEIIDKLKEI